MTTKCYLIDCNDYNLAVITNLEMAIPCFISLDIYDDGNIEFTIVCRNEDIPFVEKTLAPII